MRTRKVLPDWRWPSWRYGPNGQSAIFKCEEDVPPGWTKKPGEQPEVFVQREYELLDKGKLWLELEAKGVEIDPTWGVAHMKKVLDN